MTATTHSCPHCQTWYPHRRQECDWCPGVVPVPLRYETQPIRSEPALYIASPVVKLENWMPSGMVHVDCPLHLQQIKPSREWYEPIEDEA